MPTLSNLARRHYYHITLEYVNSDGDTCHTSETLRTACNFVTKADIALITAHRPGGLPESLKNVNPLILGVFYLGHMTEQQYEGNS